MWRTLLLGAPEKWHFPAPLKEIGFGFEPKIPLSWFGFAQVISQSWFGFAQVFRQSWFGFAHIISQSWFGFGKYAVTLHQSTN